MAFGILKRITLRDNKCFNRRGCLAIQKTMAITKIKLNRLFFIIAITQKLFAGFGLNSYPIFFMKFFISRNFLFFFPHRHRPLLVRFSYSITCPT